MTYFELFEIPVQLQVDIKQLSRKFLQLSRRYHPDFFTQDTPEAQEEALQQSALLNKAWNVFQQPDEILAYVLKLKGLLTEQEKFQLDPAFLMEMMEINEAIEEKDPTRQASLKVRLEELQQAIYAPIKKIVEEYQEGVTTEADLLKIKAYYFQKKYLDRISSSLAPL
ncbi:MAG: Fe-S protein assembly co-chaperone HscB [Chitinophagia bacterium]|nr:Fe-S protein assembly co-chaperone HscB [Chitinophagia bacterium]